MDERDGRERKAANQTEVQCDMAAKMPALKGALCARARREEF